MRIKAIPVIAEFIIVWESLSEPKQADKLANAKLMAEIEASLPGVFDVDEIRETAGYEALEAALTDDE